MKLSVADRIYILNLDTLPNSGGFLKMRVLKEFLNRLHFTADEIEKWNLVEKAGQITWNSEKVREIDVSISETLLGIIVEALEKSENISGAAVPTFEKFYELKEMFAKAIPIIGGNNGEGKNSAD